MSNSSPLINKLNSQNDLFSLHNEHHLLGYCYQFESGFHNSPLWQSHYKKQWIHNQTLLEVIDKLNLKANERQISATLLKGIHLLSFIYKDIGSRFMSDIDLLITPASMNNWYELLTDSGFSNLTTSTFYGNDFKAEWTKKIGDVEINIELHTRLFFYHKQEDWSFSPSHLSAFMILKSEDLVVHLCGHLAVQHNFSKLYWLMDIKKLIEIEANTLDWEIVKQKAKNSGNLTAVQMCLWVLNKYCNQNIDLRIFHTLELKDNKPWMKYLSMDYLIYPSQKRLNYFVIKHLSKDHLLIALRYDFSWFFHYTAKKCKRLLS